METSLETGFAQIFSCCPKNLTCPNFGGAAAPLAPPARTPMRKQMKKKKKKKERKKRKEKSGKKRLKGKRKLFNGKVLTAV